MSIDDLIFISPLLLDQLDQPSGTINNGTNINYYCIVCGTSLGMYNMRQLCEKTYCPGDDNNTFYSYSIMKSQVSK